MSEYRPTRDEIERIRGAHAFYLSSYGHAPDLDALRSCLAGRFGGDLAAMDRFWNGTMLADLPRAMVEAAASPAERERVYARWREGKIRHVLESIGLEPLAEWDRRNVHACLTSPGGLREAADALERAEREGFALHDREFEDGELPVFSWYLRRPRAAGG